jgi:uncharacterized protein YndB with AHSA1/START domain
MNQHTVTTTFQAPREEVFAYLADIEKLPEWATESRASCGSSTATTRS